MKLLCILDPTAEEIDNKEKAINILEKKWRKSDLSINPKCHILFFHTIDQVKCHNSIADLVQDYVEHVHQAGRHLDQLVACINSQCFCQKEQVKI